MSAKIVVADHIIQQKKEKTEEVELFQKVSNMNYAKSFTVAEHQLKETRQRENRKPTALPDERDLEKLRSHLIKEIVEAIKEDNILSKTDYAHLRKVVLTRIIVLNARRGSEPARMLLEHFEERDSWI
ncbi:hypothetical protein LSAT2_020445 [Lamellibrachia satsuma]|nr:hypothetical protein LSAT2_020445 [Lamellibrachia satsuma]